MIETIALGVLMLSIALMCLCAAILIALFTFKVAADYTRNWRYERRRKRERAKEKKHDRRYQENSHR